jgi:hypothetical protein
VKPSSLRHPFLPPTDDVRELRFNNNNEVVSQSNTKLSQLDSVPDSHQTEISHLASERASNQIGDCMHAYYEPNFVCFAIRCRFSGPIDRVGDVGQSVDQIEQFSKTR